MGNILAREKAVPELIPSNREELAGPVKVGGSVNGNDYEMTVWYLGKSDNSKVFKMDFKKEIFSKYEDLVGRKPGVEGQLSRAVISLNNWY